MSKIDSKEPELIEVPFYDEITKTELIAIIEKEPALKLILKMLAFSSELLETYKISPEEKDKYHILESVYNLNMIKDLPKEDKRNIDLHHFFKLELIDKKNEIIRECYKEVNNTKYLLECIELAEINTFKKLEVINKGSCECDDYEKHLNERMSDGVKIIVWDQKFLGGTIYYTDYCLGFEIFRVIGNMFPFCIAKNYRFHNKRGVCTVSLVSYHELIMFLSEINASGLKHEYRVLEG